MQKLSIIGIRKAAGEFNGRAYANLNFHVTEDFTTDDSYGKKTDIVKVKLALVESTLNRQPTAKEMAGWLGKLVTFYYDKNSQVIFFGIDGVQ